MSAYFRISNFTNVDTTLQTCPANSFSYEAFRTQASEVYHKRKIPCKALMWVSSLFYVENACLCKTVRSCRLYLLLAAKPVNALRTGLTTLRSFLRYLIDRSWALLSKKTPRCTRFFRNWIQSLRGNLATKSNRITGQPDDSNDLREMFYAIDIAPRDIVDNVDMVERILNNIIRGLAELSSALQTNFV